MNRRPNVTKLLAVIAISTSPALAGPEHAQHRHASTTAPAPAKARTTLAATGASASPAAPITTGAQPAPAAGSAAPTTVPATPEGLAQLLRMFGVAQPRELPNRRPAPGNVATRTTARSR